MAQASSAVVGKVASGVMVLCCLVLAAQAAEYTVGDDKGWAFGVAGWENGKSFSAGDVLVFKYAPGAHNVVQVDAPEFLACKVAGDGAPTYTSGNDRITLTAGRSYFICSFPGHCAAGMKIAINAK